MVKWIDRRVYMFGIGVIRGKRYNFAYEEAYYKTVVIRN